MRVVLASGSPRRRDLLAREGVRFEVCVADVDESLDDDLAQRPHDAARELAGRKARAVCRCLLEQGQDAGDGNDGLILVIGSDTMVVLGSRIYGKPADDDEAAEMIASLSGKTHEVVTGVSVCRVHPDAPGEGRIEEDSFIEVSYVTFRELAREEVLEYVACGESADKAGAYAIQGEGARLLERFEGDCDNIVGLPVKKLIARHPRLLEAEV
ncbi:MAG: Maf family protein [Eggerthellaceae bacterium]